MYQLELKLYTRGKKARKIAIDSGIKFVHMVLVFTHHARKLQVFFSFTTRSLAFISLYFTSSTNKSMKDTAQRVYQSSKSCQEQHLKDVLFPERWWRAFDLSIRFVLIRRKIFLKRLKLNYRAIKPHDIKIELAKYSESLVVGEEGNLDFTGCLPELKNWNLC